MKKLRELLIQAVAFFLYICALLVFILLICGRRLGITFLHYLPVKMKSSSFGEASMLLYFLCVELARKISFVIVASFGWHQLRLIVWPFCTKWLTPKRTCKMSDEKKKQ